VTFFHPGFALLLAANNDWVPAAVVGVLLVLLGGWFMSQHWRSWRDYSRDKTLEPSEREYYRRQFRRRMQASGTLLIIGVLVPVGDWIPWDRDDASLFTLYWLFVLGLTCWVLLLAMADLAATRAHSRVAFSRLASKQRALEAEADRLRSLARGSNGDGQRK
jgi:hypothetical protein